ncbi:MAG: UMP kinase [Candidatus Odinarchaeum yellowstonii]|uniref:Uridylate kinase n=1 Tax=Odinarchaeota yellowstonii (strain LCB_4) TaxID=1841599 RepID=A0AAF0D197_ODILC|nr:MAG: UMP kinase [Candidatus Odinarchaeum yellowstonii]
MRVVLKIGGSIIKGVNENLNLKIIRDYADNIKRMIWEGYSVMVVVGGGALAREYVNYMRSLGAPESVCDEVGIDCARLNGMILIAALKEDAYPYPVQNFREVLKLLPLNKVLVLGGVQPGQSTNAVAALLAETVSADYLINLTNVDGVYDKNPLKYSDAKLLREVTTSELERILSAEPTGAGEYPLFDPLAIKIIRRSGIPTWIVNGKNPENILKILRGENIGTKILK